MLGIIERTQGMNESRHVGATLAGTGTAWRQSGISGQMRNAEYGMQKLSRWPMAMTSVLIVVALPLCAGCLTPSPFRDSMSDYPLITTPSVETLRAMNVDTRTIEPVGEPKIVLTADGLVTHRPLYFEDPRETCGSEDGRFAWTSEDYVYMFTGPVRFMLNLFSTPAGMFCVRPWSVRESDGFADN